MRRIVWVKVHVNLAKVRINARRVCISQYTTVTYKVVSSEFFSSIFNKLGKSSIRAKIVSKFRCILIGIGKCAVWILAVNRARGAVASKWAICANIRTWSGSERIGFYGGKREEISGMRGEERKGKVRLPGQMVQVVEPVVFA